MTLTVGIIGHPLSHSISPSFQQAAFDYYSLPVSYLAWPTLPEKLGTKLTELREESCLGANITVPYKEQASAYLDEIDSWAKSTGSVNTIVRDGNKLVGYNTDSYGFMRSLKENGGFAPNGKRVVLLGAGGAARAACFALAAENVASLIIANRTVKRAECLIGELVDLIDEVEAVALQGPKIVEACANADLIVNSTSIGMSHGDAEAINPLKGISVKPSALVHDMVYNPLSTPFLSYAHTIGAKTLNGLPMLIYQGAAAFERWSSKEAPIDCMFQAGERAMASLEQIGKSMA